VETSIISRPSRSSAAITTTSKCGFGFSAVIIRTNARRLEALHDGNLPVDYSRALLIHILLERARAVVDVGNAIYTLQRGLVVTPLPGDEPRPARLG